MPGFVILIYVAVILYFFLPQHIFSRSGVRTTWFIRGFVFLNGLAYCLSSDLQFGLYLNPVWQLALRHFFLETSYVFALGAVYTMKGWRMPRFVGASIFFFYGIWGVSCLVVVQTPLPLIATVDAALEYSNPVFIVLRVTAAVSTMILFFEVARRLRHFWKSDQLLAGRLRFALLTIGAMLAFVHRGFVLGYIVALILAAPNGMELMFTLDKGFDLVATLFFLAGCAPPALIRLWAHAMVYLNQQIAILELSLLRAALMHSTTPIPWPLPDWRTRITEPSYALYSVIIDVLDRLSLLQSLPAPAKPYLDGITHLDSALAPEQLLSPLRHMARRVWFEQLKTAARGLGVSLLVEPVA